MKHFEELWEEAELIVQKNQIDPAESILFIIKECADLLFAFRKADMSATNSSIGKIVLHLANLSYKSNCNVFSVLQSEIDTLNNVK